MAAAQSDTKVGCILTTVIVSILPHAEFGRNDHREDTPHFMNDFDILVTEREYF